MFSLYSNVLRLLWYLLCVDLLFKEISIIEPMDSFCRRSVASERELEIIFFFDVRGKCGHIFTKTSMCALGTV